MSKKYNYVYITTNLENGKQYVGDHATNKLDDYYLGSGNLLIQAITKYGKENFKKEILELCESKEEAFNKQEKWINKFNTLSPNGYNISPKGGHNVSGCLSEVTKRKISESNKGKDSCMKGKTYKEAYGKKRAEEIKEKLKKPKSESHKKIISELKKGNTNFLGKHHTEETKKKISNGNKGKIRSDEVKKQISKRISGEGNPMYNKSVYDVWIEKYGKKEADKRKEQSIKKMSKSLTGLKRSQESIDRYKKAALNRPKKECPYCLRKFDSGNYKQFHGENCKRKNK